MATQTVPLQESKILRAFSRKRLAPARSTNAPCRCFRTGSLTSAATWSRTPVYIERAQGARKWDVDGNEYVDYFGGHGALLLGHNHPVVLEAVAAQIGQGRALWRIACARSRVGRARSSDDSLRRTGLFHRVRYGGDSPGPAPLARLHRKNKIIRFAGHFHGWHDQVSFPPGGAPGITSGDGGGDPHRPTQRYRSRGRAALHPQRYRRPDSRAHGCDFRTHPYR